MSGIEMVPSEFQRNKPARSIMNEIRDVDGIIIRDRNRSEIPLYEYLPPSSGELVLDPDHWDCVIRTKINAVDGFIQI